MTWGKAMGLGVIPFLPGDIAKIIAAVLVIKSLRQLTAVSAIDQDASRTIPLRTVK
jgi:biotin transporter BioY